MIEHVSSKVAAETTPTPVDSKPVQKASISDVANTEMVQPEKVVNQSKESTKIQLSHEEIETAVASLNAFVQLMDRNVSFEVDETSGRDVISVFEKESKELIRQIPSEETLELLKRMDNMVGILFSDKI